MDMKGKPRAARIFLICHRICGRTLCLVCALAFSFALWPPLAQAYWPPEAERLLLPLARQLGWPAVLLARTDAPGRAVQISNDGRAQGSEMRATISIATGLQGPCWLDQLEAQGMTRGLYRGWPAIVVRSGDRAAAREGYGLIAWRCGPYVLGTEDATRGGCEADLAATLYAAAEAVGLCGPSGTAVIPIRTTDATPINPISRFHDLARTIDWYYALNGYRGVDFGFLSAGADWPHHKEDWYDLSSALTHFKGDRLALAAAALAAAFSGVDLPEEAYLERAIIIYAVGSVDARTRDTLSSTTVWLPRDAYLQIVGPRRLTRLYVPNLVLLAEDEALGTWVHEMGHTLYCKGHAADEFGRLPDRYRARVAHEELDYLGHWGAMGLGFLRGALGGTSPAHMCSYTKEAAGWLRYVPAALYQDYELTALENQEMGDGVLTLDDPQSDDPRCYYIIEARDSDVFFGAPESGVVIYHVTYDQLEGCPLVQALRPQIGPVQGTWLGQAFLRSTLHQVADPQGAKECALGGGLIVRLLSESFSPYRATVRIELRSAVDGAVQAEMGN